MSDQLHLFDWLMLVHFRAIIALIFSELVSSMKGNKRSANKEQSLRGINQAKQHYCVGLGEILVPDTRRTVCPLVEWHHSDEVILQL